jgi:hypothetical protein
MPELIWEEYLQATLLDNDGWAMFGGVPKGKNWGSRMFSEVGDRPGWKTWNFSTYDNPFILPSLIDDIRASAPERIFLQEYMALVIDDAGTVFRKVLAAATAVEQKEAIPEHRYVMGLDLARKINWTVITIIDTSMVPPAIAYIDRFNQVEWRIQVTRVKAAAERFQIDQMVVDQTGVGDPIVEMLRQEMSDHKYISIVGFQFTNASKANIVEGLSLAFETSEISILPDADLISELQSYEMKQMPGGMMRYAPPLGVHDDMVMSLALAYSSARAYEPPVLVSPIGITKSSNWRRNV